MAIAFNIAGGGVKTIAPTSALPTITDAVIIDGIIINRFLDDGIQLSGGGNNLSATNRA